MVGKYRRHDGKKLPLTRISNTTYIGNPEKLDIADNVFIGHFNFIDSSNGLTIKTGCQITNYISIITHSSHISIRLYGKEYPNAKNHEGYLKGSVFIGEYSFVGPHSTIMPGTTIGKGCLVSAYSYVKGEFPDFSVIAGNPAKVIGDTRKLDEPFLESNPELKVFYNEWAKK
jgi:acetyltransferase-like isoleucine patch superfamily enzyme